MQRLLSRRALTIVGVLSLVTSLGATLTIARSARSADDCCYPGSPCCYPGSPCCQGRHHAR